MALANPDEVPQSVAGEAIPKSAHIAGDTDVHTSLESAEKSEQKVKGQDCAKMLSEIL